MCGRYVSPEEAEMEREYRVDRRNSDARIRRGLQALEASYNVVPSQNVPVVRVIRESEGLRESIEMRWGLVPFWSKGITPKFSSNIATMEKLENGPAWRGPWKRGQRCIMPCSGFYEWHLNPDSSKTPYYIRPCEDNTTFAFAAIWDESKREDGEVVVSCAVITMPAHEMMASIHNTKMRMPAILEKEDIETWLRGTPEQAMSVLKQFPAEMMRAHVVSKLVNSPKNNVPDLIQPVEVDPWR